MAARLTHTLFGLRPDGASLVQCLLKIKPVRFRNHLQAQSPKKDVRP